MPELRDERLDELAFRCYRRGELVADVPLPDGALARLDAAVGAAWDERPYEAIAVRESQTRWAVGVRKRPGDLARLGAGLAATSLQVAITPDGERSYIVDGEPVAGELWAARIGSRVVEALERLEALGTARFQAFAATADSLEDDLWEVRVDPL